MFHINRCILMATTLVLLAAWSTRHFAYAAKYCRPDLCQSGEHIGCAESDELGPACSSKAKKVPITAALKQLLLDEHNTIRDRVAGGKEGKLKKACRMAKMKWDKDLAKLAEYNVIQCKVLHDACHNTDKYQYAGQNLAWTSYYDPFNVTQKLLDSIQLWYSEAPKTEMKHIKKFPGDYTSQSLGHFTGMVADKNTHLGCSAVAFPDSEEAYNIFLIVCNYARTNIIDEPIYESCSKAGDNCKSGKDKKYKNLCKSSEKIDPNE